MHKAVIDVGTNSCRLIIAEITDGKDRTHVRQLRITRIGEGLGQGNFCISRAAMDRTLAALEAFRAVIDSYPATVEGVRLLGTQALREAHNTQDFAIEVYQRTGFALEVISGEAEAAFSYAGAVSGLRTLGISMPLVLDIGGGSTELFWEAYPAETDGAAAPCRSGPAVPDAGNVRGASAPIGAVRLLEKPMDALGIVAALRSGWSRIRIPVPEAHESNPSGRSSARALAAVGGTATTLAAIHLGMKDYDPDALAGLRISRAQVEAVTSMLEDLAPQERLALPGMLPGREDVMPWGLRILLGAMTLCRQDSIVIIDRDLLHGALY